MKRAIIIHGWGENPKSSWFLWAKNALEQRGYFVCVPEMPKTMNPNILLWREKLRETIQTPDSDLVLIGHSIGCQTILRYLETINVSIRRSILVTPWIVLTNLERSDEWDIAKPWLETPIDFESVRRHSKEFYFIFSDNDPFVPLLNKDLFEEKLGGTSIILHEKGHIDDESGTVELPEILEMIEN